MLSRGWMICIGLCSVGMVASAVRAQDAIIRVDGDVPSTSLPPGVGEGWGVGNAYKFLADGIDRANTLLQAGAEDVAIWVASTDPTTNAYRPDRSSNTPDGSGNRLLSFTLAVGESGTSMY